MYMWGSEGACMMDGFETPCGQVVNYLQMGAAAQCPDNFCSGFAPVGNGQIGFVQFAAQAGSGGSGYMLLTQPIPDPSLPANQIYATFAAMCRNQGCDPNQTFAVNYQFAKAVYNVSINGFSLDTSNLGGYWYDPSGFMHNGDASWSSGYFLNTPHLIDSVPMSGHIDPFGALNPLHYLLQFPAMLFPASQWAAASCSLAGGCTLGH